MRRGRPRCFLVALRQNTSALICICVRKLRYALVYVKFGVGCPSLQLQRLASNMHDVCSQTSNQNQKVLLEIWFLLGDLYMHRLATYSHFELHGGSINFVLDCVSALHYFCDTG